MPQFCVTLGFLSYVSLLSFAPHLIPSPSFKRFTIHTLVFCSWICCAVSALHPHKVFTEIYTPRHGNGRKKGKKIKYWTLVGSWVHSLQRSSAIHFEHIQIIERIMVVIVARGGLEGILMSKRPQSLQTIFNWTLILHLPGSSSFWSWRSSQHCTRLKGRLVFCFNTCQLIGRERYSPLIHFLHAELRYTTLTTDRQLLSPPLRLPQQIKRRPD